jgi:hypothetical protein
MEHLKDFKLGSHAESFQLEKNGTRIFVNLPDQESFGVIDRQTGALTKWKLPGIPKPAPPALSLSPALGGKNQRPCVVPRVYSSGGPALDRAELQDLQRKV